MPNRQPSARRTFPLTVLAVVLALAAGAGGFLVAWAATFTDQASVTDNTFTTGTWATTLATGTYTGDGVDGRQITGAGFQPDVVFIKCDCTQPGIARTSTMVGDAAKVLNDTGALQPNLVESLDANGFTIGSDLGVNGSGDTYYWVAMKAGTALVLDTYVGNDTDNRSITGVGFQPVWVATFGDGNDSIFRPATLAGDASYRFVGAAKLTDRIQALESDGFQVGTDPDVNLTGVTYHYLAWNSSADVSQSSYVGDGTDDRSIPGVGFQPQMVWVKRDPSIESTWRPGSVSGDLSLLWSATAGTSNLIQALEADGFQVGNDGQVNANGQTYHYIAFKDSGS
jgi:hypothetical protein